MLESLVSSPIFLVVVFIIFIFVMKFVFHVFFQIIAVAAAGAVFPFFMTYMGFPLPTDFHTVLSYSVLALFIYFFWLLGKMIYNILGMLESKKKKEHVEVEKNENE